MGITKEELAASVAAISAYIKLENSGFYIIKKSEDELDSNKNHNNLISEWKQEYHPAWKQYSRFNVLKR